MLIYRVKYTESESDIKNQFLLQKHPKNQNTFEKLETIDKIKNFKRLFCNMYKVYSSFLIFFFCKFVILFFGDFYIFVYYTCRSLTRVGLFLSNFQRCGGRRIPLRTSLQTPSQTPLRTPFTSGSMPQR